jgi:hypothetical protein
MHLQAISKYRGMKLHVVKVAGIHWSSLTRSISTHRKRRQLKFDTSVITAFFCRDDNSVLTSGRKQTRTWKGMKQQIRYALYSLETLFMKFVSEYGEVISR